jgi:hypothetical protein
MINIFKEIKISDIYMNKKKRKKVVFIRISQNDYKIFSILKQTMNKILNVDKF